MFQRICLWILMLFVAVSHAQAAEPAFELVRKIGDVEIRRYAPYVVAELQLPGPADRAREVGASAVANYAAGDNEHRRKLAITPPLIVTKVPESKDYWGREARPGESRDGGYIVQAVMGSGGDPGYFPKSTDARLRLRAVPGAVMAVVRFRGQVSDGIVDTQVTKLTAALMDAKLGWAGEPLVGTYDRPLTPSFMRRNEVWLRVQSNKPS